MKIFATSILACALMMNIAAHAGYDEGVAASQNGDYQRALSEWLPLAKQGQANAQYDVGMMYFRGRGVTKDDVLAEQWLNKAANQGHTSAQTILGTMYTMTDLGIPPNFELAVKWLRKAAEQGSHHSLLMLGRMYEQGRGVPANLVIACALLHLAVEQGNSMAADVAQSVDARMSKAQIASAQQLFTAMTQPGQLLNALDDYQKRNVSGKKAKK